MQKCIYAIFFSILFLLTTASAYADQAVLPNGQPYTLDNMKAYKNSPEGKNISIREGAKMSDSMNFDDCFDDSYKICGPSMGPCKVEIDLFLTTLTLKVPSAGIEFKYWEPNAIVETVCSKGSSYYENKMNMSSRLIGSANILGEEAKIGGLAAEKCVETIRKGGGVENASATPRYFNEAHVWGVGIISRFQSSASILEATVSSICGWAGKLGGLFNEFAGDDKIDAKSVMGGDVLKGFQAIKKAKDGFDSIKESAGWIQDAYDMHTSVKEGFEGLTGLDFSETISTASAIGLGAMGRMKDQSSREVRPNKLCEQKAQLEETVAKGAELEKVYTAREKTKEGFTIGTFTNNYDDGGICPIKAGTGYTLSYNMDTASGVNRNAWRETVPCPPDDGDWWFNRSTCYASGPTTNGPRISQVQIAGYYPACKGYINSKIQVYPIYVNQVEGSVANNDTLLGYRTTVAPVISRDGGYWWGRSYNYKTLADAQAAVQPLKNPDSVTCTTRYIWNWSDTWEPDQYETTCMADANAIYIEEYDHVKKLNEYMTSSALEDTRKSATAADEALVAVDQRIAELGGDCDASGEPVGTWGDALVGSALDVAKIKGVQAGLDYLTSQPAYTNLKNSASNYLNSATDKMKTSSAEFISNLTGEVGSKGADRAVGALGDLPAMDTDQFLAEAIDDALPGLREQSGLNDVVSGMGDGMSEAESMDYMQTAMDTLKMATYDGAIRQAALGIASSYDPTGLWPSFISEQSPNSWRGKEVDKVSQLKAMIGVVGHLGCSLAVLANNIGFNDSGSLLVASEDWIGCVGTWGPLEPQTGFVYHRDSLIARALAGYRGYKLAVSFKTIPDHDPKASGSPMKINMDFPHQTKCFVPGTQDITWENEKGLNPLQVVPDLISNVKNMKLPFDADGNRTADAKAQQVKDEGAVFTYWKKTKCCLYVVKWFGSVQGCFIVDRYY